MCVCARALNGPIRMREFYKLHIPTSCVCVCVPVLTHTYTHTCTHSFAEEKSARFFVTGERDERGFPPRGGGGGISISAFILPKSGVKRFRASGILSSYLSVHSLLKWLKYEIAYLLHYTPRRRVANQKLLFSILGTTGCLILR